MSTNRFFTLLSIIAVVVVVAFSIREVVASSNATPEMDSATRSYIAWGEALKAANKEGFMVPVTRDSNAIDSATHSYIAWGNALRAANKEGVMVPVTHDSNALDSATRSYIAWGNALKAANKEGFMVPVTGYSDALNSATQPLIVWAKACGVDLSYANNAELDSATRSYISQANFAQCVNTP